MILDRRSFLTGLGLSGAMAALSPRRAVAGTGGEAIPKRLLILSSGHGSVHEHWKMRPNGEPDDASWEADLTSLSEDQFSRVYAPLHAHRERMLIVDGLSMASAELDIDGYRHEKGWIHAWTGQWVHFTGEALFAQTPSLDQIVAREIARADRIPSLELMTGEGRPIAHAGLAQQMPMERSVGQAYDRVFGLSTSSDPLVRAQSSVLDFAMAERDALAPRMGARDREKLDAHFDLVRQLESRVTGLAQASCPESPARVDSFQRYDDTFKAQADLVAAAFSCDFTRVASISMGDLPSEEFGWGWYLSGDAHNDFAHRIFLDAQAAEAMGDYNRMHAAQVAYVVALLESIPDGQGGSLMDHTLIAWSNELADGWHGYERLPFVLIGGSWHFRTGRYVHRPYGTGPVDVLTPGGFVRSGTPHQHALVSIAQAMGLETDHIGLAEMHNKRGERIDLKGPLAGLV